MAVDVPMICNPSDVVAEDAVEFVTNGTDHMLLIGLATHETDSTEAIATASFRSGKRDSLAVLNGKEGSDTLLPNSKGMVDCSPCHLVVL